jgi:hypothetical protein
MVFSGLLQRNTITHQAGLACLVGTAPSIINPVTVADVEAALAAVLPDRVLDEPGKFNRH